MRLEIMFMIMQTKGLYEDKVKGTKRNKNTQDPVQAQYLCSVLFVH